MKPVDGITSKADMVLSKILETTKEIGRQEERTRILNWFLNNDVLPVGLWFKIRKGINPDAQDVLRLLDE